MTQLGLGVMINMLSSNEEAVKAYNAAQGKVIKSAVLDPDRGDGGALVMCFTDGTGIEIWDDGRSCYESRYMTTDDDLASFIGATFKDIEMRDGPDTQDEYGAPHEMRFVYVDTSLGTFTLETHNIHNGYYGGFFIKVRAL